MTEAPRLPIYRRILSPSVAFDPRLLGWLITLSVLATGSLYWNEFAGSIACASFALLLCLYFLLILFRRFQCTLLEFVAVAIALGNLEGLLVTTPGFYSLGWGWMLFLSGIATAWILSGAANANAAARILKVERSGPRLALLIAHWLTTATPALLLLGAVLAFGRDSTFLDKSWTEKISVYIAPQMAVWGKLLFGCGMCGMLVQLWLRQKIRKVIRSGVCSSIAPCYAKNVG